MRTLDKVCASVALLFVALNCALGETQSPPVELRGLWVVRSSLTSPASIHNIVSEAESHHFNALFVQVRGRGDAYYKSTLEPRAEELADTPASFDPLQTIIDDAHVHHMQVHAWMNTCYIWGDKKMPKSKMHILWQHPDWIARDARGRFTLGPSHECEGVFMTPSNTASRKHIHDVFMEVVRNYDVDGLHFDYIRYPNGSYDFSDSALSRFKQTLVGTLPGPLAAHLESARLRNRLAYVQYFPAEWARFRRDQITQMVGSISADAKRLKPGIIISAAVFADSKDALNSRGQDWKTWLQRGYVDAIVPMAYGSSTALVSKQIKDAVNCAQQAHRFVYAGLGSWHISPDSTIAKIEAARVLGTQGSVLFSYGGITRDGTRTDYLDKITHSCFSGAAQVPTMPWMHQQASKRVAVGESTPPQ